MEPSDVNFASGDLKVAFLVTFYASFCGADAKHDASRLKRKARSRLVTSMLARAVGRGLSFALEEAFEFAPCPKASKGRT
jgi:hypothetical protein